MGNDQKRPEISAIITCYFEEKTIDEFHAGLSRALEATGRSYEMIFVNDGSTDQTFERLKAIFDKDPHVTIIMDLFRNAGQAAAATAGICEARGDIFLSMDSDLQLDPAELPLLLSKYDAGYDVVSGQRKDRKDSRSRKIPSKIANMIMRRASRSKLTDFGCTFKLYNAKLVRCFNHGPHDIFNPVTIISKAQRVVEVPVTHLPRKVGKSGWTLRKLWRYQMLHVVNMSEQPFQLLGLCCLALAGLFTLRTAVGFLLPLQVLSQVTNGLLLNALLISTLAILAVLSMIGEFSIRSFIASQRVPQYLVRTTIRRRGNEVIVE